MSKFCLPVKQSRSSDVINMITGNLESYECFEIWLDYLDDFDEHIFTTIESFLNKDFIFLFRRMNLDPIGMPLQKRLDIITKINAPNFMVDLDITTQKAELNFVRENKLPLEIILSYHNYDRTPTNVQLNKIMRNMESFNPDVYKYSVYCADIASCSRMLELLSALLEADRRFIVTGMGELGKIIRVAGAMAGNEFNFAPLTSNDETAKGQFTLGQFKNIIKNMEFKNAR